MTDNIGNINFKAIKKFGFDRIIFDKQNTLTKFNDIGFGTE